MPRAREIGIRIGALPTGPTNSVLDVAGVGLGHTTLVRDEPAPPDGPGHGAHRRHHAAAGRGRLPPAARGGRRRAQRRRRVHRLPDRARSGALIETPVYLTSTMQLGRVYDAACEIALEQHPERGRRRGDPGRRRVRRLVPQRLPADAGRRRRRPRRRTTRRSPRAALDLAAAEGAVGAGTGMSCLGFKGGIGTASRVTPDGHTVAVLLLTNFGERDRLTVDGVPGGPAAAGPARRRPDAGGLVHRRRGHRRARRPARLRPARPPDRARAWPGPARPRTTAAARSSWPRRPRAAARPRRHGPTAGPRVAGRGLDPLFEAVVDAAEEAVLNSLLGVADHGRARRQHQRGARPGTSSRGCCARQARAGH